MAITRPTLRHGRGSTYVENSAPVSLCADLVVTDRSSATLTSATIHIGSTFEPGHDYLAFTDQNGITGSYDAATGTLTLTGVASVADYQAALRSVTYYYDGDDPLARPRTFDIVVDDGTQVSAPSTVRVGITPVNDPTVLTVDPSMIYTTFGLPAVIDATLTVVDVDSDDRSATVTITNYVAGEDVLTWVDTQHLHGTFRAGSGTLEVHGRASAAEYQEFLRSVAYTNTSSTPNGVARVITFEVEDLLGADSGVGTVTITIAAPPVVTTSGTPVGYTEGDPATTLEASLTLTDVDDPNMVGATVAITAGFDAGDSLLFTDTANITGSYNAATGVLTLTGTASKAEYQAALRSIQFVATSDDPSSSKTVTWLVDDGSDGNSAPVTTTITVTPVNDAPAVAISDTLAYTENDAAAAIAPGATVADPDSPDFNGGSLTVSFTANGAAEDQLTIVNQGTGAGQVGVSGSNVTFEGNVIGTFSGGTNGADLVVAFTTGAATAAAVQALMRDIGYSNASDNPSTLARTVGFTLVDGDGTANGGVDTGSGSATINVTSVNDAPTIATTATPTAYTEGGSGVAVDAGIALADLDSANLTGATVAITAGFDAGDSLVFTDTANITGSYNSGTGVLTLSGTDTVANYEAALRSVQFVGTSDAPTASKTVSWTVTDGTDSSSTPTTSIDVTPVNDAPAVSISDTLAYTENGAAAAIATGATLGDPDSADFAGGSLTVSFTANGTSADQLSILDQGTGAGQIGVSGSNVTYEGATIGSFSGGANGADLVVTFSGSAATQAAVQALVRDIAFSNTSDNPSTLARTVGYTLVDGDGTANGGADTGTASATVNVTAVNDAPTLTPSGSASYTEGGTAAAVNASLALADPDDTNLESATVSITGNFQAGDSLGFVDQNGITGSYNAGTGVLTLTGTSSLANYQTALRSVTFQSSNDAPTTTKTVSWVVNDGTDSSSTQTSTINVTPVNDAPVLSTTFTTPFTEGNAGMFTTPTATLSDADSADFNGGSLTVHFSANGSADDLLFAWDYGTGAGQIGVSSGTVTYEGATIGTISGGTAGSDLVVQFTTANATQAAVQALLQAIAYWNNSDNPSTATRTVTYTLVDGDGTANGGADTGTGTSTITMTAVNDAPTVTTGGGSLAWTEGDAAAAIDTALTLADPDDTNLESATVSISAGFHAGDVLGFTDQNGITGSYNSGTGVLTLTGTATVAQYQAALRSVTFVTPSTSPGSSRTISYAVNDGTDSSTTQTKAIAITEVNSAPVVTTSGGSAGFVENSPAVVVDSGLTVSDPDTTTLAGATVHISAGFQSGEDVLSFTTVGSITGSYNASTGTLTLSGTDTLANYQTALESVKYDNTSDTPNMTTRTLEFQLNDGQGVSNLSTVATRDVTVTATNDAPVVIAGQTLLYTENQAATAITSSITVTDPDSADFNGGSLTVAFTSNGTADDQLAIGNQGVGAGQVGVSGANVTYGGTVIGTYTGGTNGSSLVVSLNASATPAAVQALARDITFANTSDAPSTAARTVTFTVVDGDGGTDTGSATATVNVTSVNDAPVLANGAGTTLAYTENDAATAINSGLTISDVDSANLTGATVTISSNYQSGEDVLSFTTVGSITGSFNAGTGVLTLSGTDTVANYQAAIDSVKYVNTSDNPSAATRTVSFQVDDGSALNHFSNTVTRDIGVTPVNDAPAIAAGGTLAYTENGAAAAINGSITVTDAESDNLTGAHVTISSAYQSGEDVLSFTPVGNITGSFDSGTGVLTLSGTDTAANYQLALRSVTYVNTSDDPHTAARTISFDATDSHGDTGATATSTVTVAAVNDAPVNTVPADSSVGTAFSNTAMSISGVSISDVDAESGTLTVHVTAVSGGVTFSLAGGASVSAGTNGTADVTLSGTATQLNAALATLSYKSNDGFTGSDTITVVTNDGSNTGSGGAKSDTDTFHVGVVPQVFIIDNTDATSDASSNAGSAANPYNSIASFNTNASDGAGDYIYINHGTGTYSEASGLTLNNNEQVYGQGQTLSFTNPVTGEVVTIGTGTVGNTPTISITGASQAGVMLAQGNTLKGFDIATTLGSQTAITDGGGTVGTLNVNDVSISGTGMAVDIDQGGALAVTIDSLSSSGSSQQGVQLAGTLTGSFTGTTGAISGSTGTGFLVGDGAGTANTGGTFTLNYGGTVSTTGTARAVDVEDRSSGAGTVTFSGNISHSGGNANGIFVQDIAGGAITFSGSNLLNTGTSNAIQASNVTSGSLSFSGSQTLSTTSGAGISLSSNSVATSFTGSAVGITTTTGTGVAVSSNSGSVSFNDTGTGLDIATNGGTGLSATSSGTLTIQGTSNTISSTGATALNVSSTTIGAAGLNFVSVSSTNAANGIVLNSTGSTGALTVTGSGTANSGGTISGSTGDGISVTSGEFNIGYMQVMNTAGNGINASNLVGTSTFSNGTITNWDTGNSFTKDGIKWVSASSTAGTLTLTNDTLSGASGGNSGLYVEAQSSGAMTLTVSSSAFTGLEGDGIYVSGITGATSVQRVTVQNSSFTNAVASTGNGGISLNPFGNETFYADINNNNFDSIMNPVSTLGAIGVTNGANANADITIRNNTINHIAGGRGITVTADGGTTDLLIDNNSVDNLGSTSKAAINVGFTNNTTLSTVGAGNVTVSNNDIGQNGSTAGNLWTSGNGTANAILLQTLNGSSMTAAITNNIVDANTTSAIEVVRLRAAATTGFGGGTINATVSGNDIQDTEATTHVEFDATAGTSTLGGTVNLNITGNTLPGSGVGVIKLTENAAGTLNVTQSSSAAVSTANSSATVTVTGSPQYSSPAPTTPTTPSLPLLAHDHVDGVQDAHTVTTDELTSIVSAAANRWSHLPLTAAQLDTLANLTFTIGHLAGDNLAAEAAGLIVIDDDAAGHGWYVDATPNDDSEFTGSGSHLQAAGTQYDLLTAVMHEIGHALGLSDTYANADDIMYGYLDAGERRLPFEADVHVVGSAPAIQVYEGGGA